MKMKVKMLVSMAGLSLREPGQILELDEQEAKRLIAAGFAEPVTGKGIEAAVVEPLEKTILPRAKPKRANRKKAE